MRLKLSEVADCLGAKAEMPEVVATGVAIDSRVVEPGDIFFCLPGERVDGHDFASRAVEKGAICVIAARELDLPGIPVIVVADVCDALGRLAAFWRTRTKAKVICVTGTAGKTTLKDLLAGILSVNHICSATAGNHNNQIGLPLTILATTGDEDLWLLEAGISHAGDMEYLASIARPDIAIILNAGTGHTDGLGREGVAWHKTRLLNYLTPGGMGIVNADYPELAREAEATGAKILWFGNSRADADFGPVWEAADGFAVKMSGVRESYRFGNPAVWAAETVLAAVSGARALGIGPEQIQAGFDSAVVPERRFSVTDYPGFTIIDDSYNANPLSMRRSLMAAARLAEEGSQKLIVVLGEMGELGESARSSHEEIGKLLASIKPAAVYWKGGWADAVREHCKSPFYELGKPEDFEAVLRNMPSGARPVILFKGSRMNRLEDYLDRLAESVTRSRRQGVL